MSGLVILFLSSPKKKKSYGIKFKDLGGHSTQPSAVAHLISMCAKLLLNWAITHWNVQKPQSMKIDANLPLKPENVYQKM